ncbi:hypothetical protein FB1_12820 [Flavobacterium branchiophilum NBRC 15030 = ATCC 35035]|nr:hypothetical protein FB1_12820 [Flavobacterium branchiophilum NBRC 15030 = ATCC 35035]
MKKPKLASPRPNPIVIAIGFAAIKAIPPMTQRTVIPIAKDKRIRYVIINRIIAKTALPVIFLKLGDTCTFIIYSLLFIWLAVGKITAN